MQVLTPCDECATGAPRLDPLEGTCVTCHQFPGQTTIDELLEDSHHDHD